MTTVVKCPTCQVQVFWNTQSPHRPFCSKRCQLIDLGEWSEENNKISSQLTPSQELNEAAKQEMNYFSNLLPQFINKIRDLNFVTKCDAKPIFILGLPRSGTTMIENIIARGEKKNSNWGRDGGV